MNRRPKAFTLAELLVVMGIIVLFITLAIPAIRGMTGSSSTSVARNELAALVTRAREEAVGVQSVRGVLFFIDPASDRVVGVICQAASLQDPNLTAYNIILLDAVPSRDTLQLPTGVRLQTVYNNTSTTATPTTMDRYLGFNPVNTSVKIGGCILFDGNGKLISRPYGFQMAQLNGATASLSALGGMLFGTSTTLASLTGDIVNATASSYSYVPGYTTAPSGATPALSISQLGMVLFDYDAFQSLGFKDIDAVPNNQPYGTGPMTVGTITQTQSEQAEETWLDTNSAPVMVNRFNGTLIRGE